MLGFRTVFGRPLLAVLATLSLVIATAAQPKEGRLKTVVLVFQSTLLGASIVCLAERPDAAGLTHFGAWFFGH